MILTSKSLSETEVFAQEFVSSLQNTPSIMDKASVVGLFGDLGSGKTSFLKGVAKAYGVLEVVTSPTYVLEKIYKLKNQRYDHLIHIDTYRLENADELRHLGWKEICENPKNIVFIEWPERVEEVLPKDMKKIFFTFIDENTREIKME